jgi:hypothetical protein
VPPQSTVTPLHAFLRCLQSQSQAVVVRASRIPLLHSIFVLHSVHTALKRGAFGPGPGSPLEYRQPKVKCIFEYISATHTVVYRMAEYFSFHDLFIQCNTTVLTVRSRSQCLILSSCRQKVLCSSTLLSKVAFFSIS